MNSPARKHFEMKTAALVAEQGSGENRTSENANQYELMLAKLAEDKRRLSTMQSMEKRANLKAEILAEYEPWLKGVLEGNQGVQDDVLMTCMVWYIDAGLLDSAVQLASYAITHGLKMPDQYNRKTAVVIADEVADHYLKQRTAGNALDLSIIEQTMAIVENQDMPDEVQAKLYKVRGYAGENPELIPDFFANEAAQLQFCLDSFNRALTLNEKVGVKKDIESVERKIKNLATEDNK